MPSYGPNAIYGIIQKILAGELQVLMNDSREIEECVSDEVT